MGLTRTNSFDSLRDGMCTYLNVVTIGEPYANPREIHGSRLSGCIYTLTFFQTMILVWTFRACGLEVLLERVFGTALVLESNTLFCPRTGQSTTLSTLLGLSRS